MFQFSISSLINLLSQVTMVGGHVIEFAAGTQQIVALHTIP